MAVPTFGWLDPALLAGFDPFPLSLVSDGDRATADITLDGELPAAGGAYAYLFDLNAGDEYRFQASPDQGFGGELAVLVDCATGDIVWGSTAALESFGYERATAAALSAAALSFEVPGTFQLIVWAPPGEPDAPAGEPTPFHLQAHVDSPVPPVEVPPDPPPIDVPPDPPPVTDDPVFRFFDAALQSQWLTTSAEVRDWLLAYRPDLRFDGEVFVGDDQPREGWVPVFELFDQASGRRHYTADTVERDALLASTPTLVDQGAALYVPGADGENATPVYRMEDLDTGAIFLTSNVNERLYLLLQGNWADDGIAFNAWVPPPPEAPPVDSLEPLEDDLGADLPDAVATDPLADEGAQITTVGVVEDAPPLIA